MKSQQYYNSLPECSVIDYDLIPLPEAALLWCGVKFDDLAGEVKLLNNISQSIYSHPYIPCLEKKTKILTKAVNNGELTAVREHGEGGGHVAYLRRHFWIKDLKQFITDNYPNDRPKTIFNDEELKATIDLNEYERMSKEYQKFLAENTNLREQINELKIEIASKNSQIRDQELAMQSLAIQIQNADNAKKTAENQLELGRNYYSQLRAEHKKLLAQKSSTPNPEVFSNTLKLMSLAIPDLPKQGDKMTASGLNTFLNGVKAKHERENNLTLPYSVPDTKTLSKYLRD